MDMQTPTILDFFAPSQGVKKFFTITKYDITRLSAEEYPTYPTTISNAKNCHNVQLDMEGRALLSS
jgi:hypothetical protein